MKIFKEAYFGEGVPKHSIDTIVKTGTKWTVQSEHYSLEETFQRVCEGHYWNDINHHAPTLRRFSSECDVVAEFGLAVGCSARALITGSPKKFISVEIVNTEIAKNVVYNISELCERLKIQYVHHVGDDLAVDIGAVDLLHLDSNHRNKHVIQQLQKNKDNVNKYILGHDYDTSSVRNAFQKFLLENKEWEMLEQHNYNYGMIVIGRR